MCAAGRWRICGMSLEATRWGHIKGSVLGSLVGGQSRWAGGVVSAARPPLREACE